MDSIPDPAPNNIMAQFILIGILILVNAFLASAEMAIISLNKNKIKNLAQEGNRKAPILAKLIEEPTKFLSTIQIVITVVGFVAIATTTKSISNSFAGVLNSLNVTYSKQTALALIIIAITYLMLVFGEFFPKRIAQQKSEAIAMFSVVPILYISKLVVPFVWLISASTNFLVKITGVSSNKIQEEISKEELKLLIEVGQERGTINDPIIQFLDQLLEGKYSRVPVYDGDKNYMAVLIDEYGGFTGIVTTKDLIEEVMGNIEDEYDCDEPNIRKIDNNTYMVDGLLSIGELNDSLDLNLVSENYNTIGGFLVSLLGCIPKKNENKTIQYGNITFKIEEVKERRIGKIKIFV